MRKYTLSIKERKIHKYTDCYYRSARRRTNRDVEPIPGGCEYLPYKDNARDLKERDSAKAAGLAVMKDYDICPNFCQWCFGTSRANALDKYFKLYWRRRKQQN